MTKLEKIQEAYGEHWETVKNYIDENGNFSKVDLLISGLKYYELSSISFNHNDTTFRPKSLQGIENNNGWIKIESEDDLPKKLGEFDFMYEDRIIRMGFNPKFEDLKNCTKVYTHYRPIEKPQPPIY
jgi:hypothetical protein